MDYGKYINAATTAPVAPAKERTTVELPKEGWATCRLVQYIEQGRHRTVWQGQEKVSNKFQLALELSGKNAEPRLVDGIKIPHLVFIGESLSTHEKSNCARLLSAMSGGDRTVVSFAQLLGKPFMCKVFHKQGADNKTYVNVRDQTGFHVLPPIITDPETGERRILAVPEPLSPIRLFLWDHADKAMWDALKIDGVYPDGKSKNVIQAKIRMAANFPGSAAFRADSGRMSEFDEAKEQMGQSSDDWDDIFKEPEPVAVPVKAGFRPGFLK